MDKTSRREAIRQYKERKVPVGIFAIRCRPTAEAWVGASRNLDGQRNSSFFSLRLGSHRNRDMQAAWKAHGGEEAFEFSILELLEDEDLGPLGRDSWLKERERHWLAQLGARSAV
ncbi:MULTISPECIES: GIY-YIG nuclease family protein [Phenylobacterium]|uniref:GIY-YIG nuclease family protein n=1 Tax=Phenylobacterium koreense TaxID=266125 RepID=A0ABV2EEC4_9CAUL